MDGGMTLLGGSILFKSDMPIMTVTDVAEQLRRLVLSSKSRLCVYVCVCACAVRVCRVRAHAFGYKVYLVRRIYY